ncbi:3'-5' exoribonuclease domain-containing protein [Mycobacteroides salmoniphilum]|uniref:3'-5' exoribonuclease domain-containing protein n=1 Tax=Mycobacteroides salmoniphilum TaxID=404941 RepID=UPI0010646999|nr:3'-5' exoribonuclease [Mycobacteroides salmoniphilum]TDZ94768.1 3'-5' exoribonuclease.1 [Mycobacteroides salmoniphilum]
MTIYCYDTEFLEDGRTIDLISIGIVCEDGREYYAVNSEADWDRIRKDDWLMDNVVRHLPTHSTGQVKKRQGFGDTGWSWGGIDMRSPLVKPKWVIANEVRQLIVGDLADRDEAVAVDELPVLWAYYGAYDHVALCQLWGRMIHHPRFMPMYTLDLKQEMDRLGVSGGTVPKPDTAHDALSDARWNWQMLNKLRLMEAGTAEVPF